MEVGKITFGPVVKSHQISAELALNMSSKVAMKEWVPAEKAKALQAEIDSLLKQLADSQANHIDANSRNMQARAEIDAAWQMIEHGWDIEDRAYFERESKTNGFKYALAQAVHHMWKRRIIEDKEMPWPEVQVPK